jgi:hypothetical protein
MNTDDAVLLVVAALDAAKIPYMLAGSFSSNFFGIPRSTQYADFVVQLANGASLATVATQLGDRFKIDPQMSFETIAGTVRQEMHIVGTDFKIEFFHLSDDPHDVERFRRRQRVATGAVEADLPTVEDVIVMKLRWARSKDRDDIQSVIAVQGGRIDWAYVNSWAERHGTRQLLDELRASIPRIDD